MELNPRELLAGDIWSTAQKPNEVFNVNDTKFPGIIDKAEIRITRLPDWNAFFILPLYKMYRIDSDEDRVKVAAIEGPDYLTEEDADKNIVLDHVGVAGIRRQLVKNEIEIVFTKEVIPERFLYNVHNFNPYEGYAVVTAHPMEAILLMAQGIENVLSVMTGKVWPAQATWLCNHARKGVILVNVDADPESLSLIKVERINVELDVTKIVQPKTGHLAQVIEEVKSA